MDTSQHWPSPQCTVSNTHNVVHNALDLYERRRYRYAHADGDRNYCFKNTLVSHSVSQHNHTAFLATRLARNSYIASLLPYLGAGLAGIRMNGKTTFLFRDVSGLGSATQHVQ